MTSYSAKKTDTTNMTQTTAVHPLTPIGGSPERRYPWR
jgi:hypothetical protein